MKTLIPIILLMGTLFSCEKFEEVSPVAQAESEVASFNPLARELSWEYQISYIKCSESIQTDFGQLDRASQGDIIKWTDFIVNSGDVSAPLEAKIMYHERRHHRSDGSSIGYNIKFLRQEGQDYYELDNLYLKDAPVGTNWKVDRYNASRMIADRHEHYILNNTTYENVIEVHEIKKYNNGDQFILAKEFYAENIGLVFSEGYTYENHSITGLKRTMLTFHNN